MYEYNNNIYAEAGSILQGTKAIGMSLPNTLAPFTERPIDLTNLTIDGKYLYFDIFKWKHNGIHTYAEAKRFVVGKRYSNDDQIAIILNKDDSEEDALAYAKMQEWREWASLVAHKIIDVINNTDQSDEDTY